MIPTGATRLAGVMGWPVTHSRSPRLHGYWLEQYGIDGAYLPLPVRPNDFATALQGLAAAGFAGVNVTVPHKQAAFALCTTVAETAHRAGAVNTIVFEQGSILGINTDGDGFLRSVAEEGVDPATGPALILGAGGAARAIAAALLVAGVRTAICTRRPAAAAELAAALPGLRTLPWSMRAQALGDYALLVNASTGGMTGKPPLDMVLDTAPASLVVADIVYAPRETALLTAARLRGLRRVEGIGMLLHQAVLGFHAWFGIEPAVDTALRDFVLAG